MKCSVCTAEISENYCSKCGQYFKNERISTKSILTDLFESIFSLEKSFFKNIKIGLFKPNILVSNYWRGFRSYYYSPSKFLVIASLFFLAQITLFNDFFGLIVGSKVAQQFTLLIVIIVVLSFFSFVIYLKYKRSFYEHLILNIYNVSVWSIIFVPISIISNLLNTSKNIETGFIFLYLLLIIIWNSKIFEITKLKRYIYIALNCILLVIVPFLFYKIFGT
jgi:hypothetical protein|tara:strand:- start:200 stop:862 length:663 start_codon:yes stop_codon:yes gene_type:complete